MGYFVTSKPWLIVNEYERSRGNSESLFPESHQLIFQARWLIPPVNISSSMVHAMRVVRLISIAGLKPRTFKSWANRVISYLNAIPGKYLHIFDNYG